MKKQEKIDQIELIDKLDVWFKANQGNVHQWSRSPLGLYLKLRLKSLDHWKACPRGNPRKGGNVTFQRKIESLKQNNPDYQEESNNQYEN